MANRKRGTFFLPQELQTNERLSTKKELAQRKSIPLCPPVPYKIRRSVLAAHGIFDKPKPLCFTNSESKHWKLTLKEGVFTTKPIFFGKFTFSKKTFNKVLINSGNYFQVELSPIYNPSLERSYFEQMFMKHTLIGEGSFGQVYRVRSVEDSQLYAIKRLKSAISFKDRYAEVRNNEKVGIHQNCVRFFMAWEESYEVYMLLEYCDMSLSDFSVLNNDIPEDLLWGVLFDICKALNYLHKKELLHLDVKPGNIMMKNGYYKLADFGILVDLKLAPLVCKSTLSDGDSKYLALEVLEGIYKPSCDIFGLGISLLELAADLELPSHGPLWQQLRHEILPQNFYDRVSLGFKVVIERMLKPDYNNRPTAEKILKYSTLKAIEKRDKKSARVNYAADVIENEFDLPIEDDLPIMINNNIIETPHCVPSASHNARYDMQYRSIKTNNEEEHHGILNRKILFPVAKKNVPSALPDIVVDKPKLDSGYESSCMSLDEDNENSILAVDLTNSYQSDDNFTVDMDASENGHGSRDTTGCFEFDDDDIITSTPLSRCKLRKDMSKTKLSFE